MFTQKSLQHTIAQLQERIQELEAELKQKISKSRRLFLLSTIVYKALSKSINL